MTDLGEFVTTEEAARMLKFHVEHVRRLESPVNVVKRAVELLPIEVDNAKNQRQNLKDENGRYTTSICWSLRK